METFAEAARAYAGLVAAIRSDQWDQPGLGDWDLRTLVGHTSRSLLTVEAYLQRPATAEDLPDAAAYLARIGDVDPAEVAERGRQASRALGPDPVGFVTATVERVLPLAERSDDPLIMTLLGGMRLSAYLPTRTFELVVHGLDIARSAGLPEPAYSEAVLREVLSVATGAAVRMGQAPALLRALTGRAALADGFSVV